MIPARHRLMAEWSPIKVTFRQPASAADIKAEVQITVTNTGKAAGADVVQIYITDPECTYRRPKQELAGLAKVQLQPGESKAVSITLDKLAFSFYNDEKACWVAEKGKFILTASKSSKAKDGMSAAEFELENTLTWTGL